jgi:hypothetical protein
MRYGAYKGRTIADVASTGGGREYLNSLLAKKKVPRALRSAILEHAMWFNNQAVRGSAPVASDPSEAGSNASGNRVGEALPVARSVEIDVGVVPNCTRG